jgi:signal peptidase I
MRIVLVAGTSLIGALIAFAFFSALGVYSTSSDSMRPTLQSGDRFTVDKFAYGVTTPALAFGLGDLVGHRRQPVLSWSAPGRGDVILFLDRASAGGEVARVGRVAAVGGDRIELVGGRLILNGEPVPAEIVGSETYFDIVGHQARSVVRLRETWPGGVVFDVYDMEPAGPLDDFGPAIVPTGLVFVLGDNRDASLDSRVPRGPGMVPLGHVIGRVQL